MGNLLKNWIKSAGILVIAWFVNNEINNAKKAELLKQLGIEKDLGVKIETTDYSILLIVFWILITIAGIFFIKGFFK